MNRIATVSIIVEKKDDTIIQKVNDLLHEYQDIIQGRMGLPLREKNVSIISVALFADENEINALTGKLGRIDGVQAKTLYSKKSF